MMAAAEGRFTALSGNSVAIILLGQLLSCAVLAVLFRAIDGRVAGYSALLGGLTCVIPNAFLALRLAAPRRDTGARGLLRAAYIGEIGKIALTVLMFSLIFTLVRPLAAGPLFAGFVAATLVTFAGFLAGHRDETGNKRTINGG